MHLDALYPADWTGDPHAQTGVGLTLLLLNCCLKMKNKITLAKTVIITQFVTSDK